MRQKILSSAQEQIKDPSNIAFEGGDEIDRANIETERYINLQRLKTRELKLLRKIDYALYKIRGRDLRHMRGLWCGDTFRKAHGKTSNYLVYKL